MVIYPVAVFFLFLSFEKTEAGGEEYIFRAYRNTVGQLHVVVVPQAVDERYFCVKENICLLGAFNKSGNDVCGRSHVREQPVPFGDMSSEARAFLHYDRGVPEFEKL